VDQPAKNDKAQDRREKAAALRRAEQAKVRRRRIIGLAIAVVVVVVAVVIGIVVIVSQGTKSPATSSVGGSQIVPTTPTGTTTVQSTPKRVANTSGIRGVLAWDTDGWPGDGTAHTGALEHDHVAGPVKYAVLPPVGGPHNAIWMNAGVYTKPVPSERAVHNLEHGAVWITYDPDLSKAKIAKLTAFVGKQSEISEPQASASSPAGQSNRYMDLTPWATNSLPSSIVISAWGHQLRVTSPTDPRLQQFVDKFRHNATYSPEYGAAVDGIPILTGGRPAIDGSTKANPAGSTK
jgi:hypothetical protein